MRRGCAVLAGMFAVLTASPAWAQEQSGDLDWRPQVVAPAYAADGPLIRVDEGHGSVQTITGRYAGFAALSRADGYRVDAGAGRLDAPGALDGVGVLVISNAATPRDGSGRISAFDEAELEAVVRWVEAGGALLLAADHAPHGSAAEALAARFGVGMGKGYAFRLTPGGLTANLDFLRADGALGAHPIIVGRSPAERIDHVRTFTGQSLTGPPGATVLMAMKPEDREAADQASLQQIRQALDGPGGADALAALSRPALPAQGLAFEHGAGRVVVLGEAGMLTAQIVRFAADQNREPMRFGLNTTGHDDQQFVLNTLHWLSRLIP
ncbi:DUF4350 domain-containing protein [Brevundimonas sp. CEF1]|uniref:DUF4350 domain-containing protein n=1 Tax=Brevundimonas sp. CEF1 TaxID=3442642 RepID=UPI003F513F1D